jgi:hypothetical protein
VAEGKDKMLKGKIIGRIGSKNLRPIRQMVERNGEQVPFMRMTLICEDRRKKVGETENGRPEYAVEYVQVLFPNMQRWDRLFPTLQPGQRVEIEGDITFDPRVSDKTGQAYVNMKIFPTDLTFMESPVSKQVARMTDLMISAGIFSEEQGKANAEKVLQHLAKQAEQNSQVIDETESQDPNHPEFA